MYNFTQEHWSISIHALREEGDHREAGRKGGRPKFLSTPSARRATLPSGCCTHRGSHFYPRPPRGGRRLVILHVLCLKKISIHALREEGDFQPFQLQDCVEDISIHALREEGDGSFSQFILDLDTFLSTPSARRATAHLRASSSSRGNFYPRPPRGGRHADHQHPCWRIPISIHALREEGDAPIPASVELHRALFLSTPSARRATFPVPQPDSRTQISIHALREEGDVCVSSR